MEKRRAGSYIGHEDELVTTSLWAAGPRTGITGRTVPPTPSFCPWSELGLFCWAAGRQGPRVPEGGCVGPCSELGRVKCRCGLEPGPSLATPQWLPELVTEPLTAAALFTRSTVLSVAVRLLLSCMAPTARCVLTGSQRPCCSCTAFCCCCHCVTWRCPFPRHYSY